MADKEQLTLYGSLTTNFCGFCHKHRVCITPKQVKKKQCIQKGCTYLQRYVDHDYWRQDTQQRNKRKALRKIRKARLDQLYREATHQ